MVFFAVAASVATSRAAGPELTGRVTDSDGKPVGGAVVTIVGTSVGTVADAEGHYMLRLPDAKGYDVEVSFLGYKTLRAHIGGAVTRRDFTLEEDAKKIDDVVVVGYGEMRKSDLTGAVTSVKVDETQAARMTSLDQMLRGRAAGVQITANSSAPGAGVNVLIRGTSSFNSGSEPLYVVDGVIMNAPSDMTGAAFSQGTDNTSSVEQQTNGLLGLNPQDIASIEILKDASATAIYGAQGANGVVLITTRMGEHERPSVSFTTGITVGELRRRIPMLSAKEYIEYLDARGNITELSKIFTDPSDRSLGYKPGIEEVDWQDYVMRTAVSHNHQIAISGRGDGTSYNISAGYSSKQGIIKGTSADVATFRINLDQQLSKRVKIGTRSNLSYINLSMTQSTSAGTNSASTSMMRSVTVSRPFYNFAKDDNAEDLDLEEMNMALPPRWLTEYVDERTEWRVLPNLYLEWKIAEWLKYRVLVGCDYRNVEQSKYKGRTLISTAQDKPIAVVANAQSMRATMDHMLLFEHASGPHRISGTAGVSVSNTHKRTGNVEGWNFEQSAPGFESLNYSDNTRGAYDELEYGFLSFLARAVYSYRDRYVLTATFRADGSSKFARKNRYGYFPSFAFAWRLMEEEWMRLPYAFSNLKLRLGWGRVGNAGLQPYQTLTNYGNTTYPDHTPDNNKEATVGVIPLNHANTGLRWETTEQYNIGLDLGLFDNRVAATVDLYRKMTYDLLQRRQTPLSNGFTTMWENTGKILNKGLEISLDTYPVRTKRVQWNLGGNISFNRNRIEEIGYRSDNSKLPPYFLGSQMGTGSYLRQSANIFMEGKPMGLFWGYRTDGIVGAGETGPGFNDSNPVMTEGGVRYVLSPDNKVGYLTTDDLTVIGNPNPDFTYGLYTTLSVRNFTLSVNLDGVYGNDIVDANLMVEQDVSRINSSINIRKEAFYGAWSPENPNGRYPALDMQNPTENYLFTDRIVCDGSFLRLSSIMLSYRVPLKKRSAVRKLTLSFSANNLCVWTDYPGWDPEVSSFGNNVMRMGIDSGSYPSTRSYSFGVSLGF